MIRSILTSSVAACICLGLATPVFAAEPAATAKPPAVSEKAAAAKPAAKCLTDLRAFDRQMLKDGYWLSGSGYGYGYPMMEVTPNASLLVLDTTKSVMEAGPRVSHDQFATPSQFVQQSQKVDAYWETHLSSNGTGRTNG